MLRHCNSCVLYLVLVFASSCLISTVHSYQYGYISRRTSTTTTPPPTEALLTPKEYLDSKSGFSTFGIIAIIFTIIVLSLVFYYGVMCYPLLCRDDKKYRFMDVSSTITTATSRSIQSIENYPVDQKHHHTLA
ncbi:hypothetical protein ACLKA7_002719 [Drosophila subpalustris]